MRRGSRSDRGKLSLVADAGPNEDPDALEPAIGTVLEGRYELTARLGEGGVGWVYRAKHVRLGTEVAIKMLQAPYDNHESLRPRFEREAQALAQLRHPNIVTMTDYSVADGRPYLVMERLEGVTLAELLAHGAIPEERARRIMRQTLDGLIYAHGRGYAHRDLKPSNIFLVELPTDPDHVKILDFGFVKLMRDGEEKKPALTVSGLAFGTPSYMCPEQASGAPTDPRADVYSAGVVFFEMLAGRKPFVGEIPEVIRAHLTQPVPKLTVGELEAGRELRAFIERALAKSPIDRFQSAGEMREALDALPTPALVPQAELHALEHAETVPPPPPSGAPRPAKSPARPPPPPPPIARAAPRRSRPVGLAIAITLLLVGGSWAIYVAVGERDAARDAAGAGESTALAAEPMRASESAPGGTGDPIETQREEIDVAPPETVAGEGLEGGALDETAGLDEGVLDPTAVPGEAPLDESAAVEALPAEEALAGGEPGVAPLAVEEASAPADLGAEPPAVAEAMEPQEVAAPAEGALADPWSAREPVPLLDAARRTLSRGRPLTSAGERRLREYVREHRSDPRPHLLLAQHYLERGVDRGSIERYGLAERVDASARLDPRMLPDLVRLASRRTVSQAAGDLIVRLYGREGIAEVVRALASDELDQDSRARLEALRARLSSLALSP